MPSGPHRPRFYLGSADCGVIVAGGALDIPSCARLCPRAPRGPSSPAPGPPPFGPVSMDLLVVDFTLGPIGLHVSILSLVGVLLAYLIARSLF